MGIYLNDWAEDGEAQMLSDFGIDKDMLEGADVLFASYTYEDYSGSAFVLCLPTSGSGQGRLRHLPRTFPRPALEANGRASLTVVCWQ
jgi:hypothetical protein